MECRTAQTLLEAYLDGELERSDARDLEAHVDRCADCRGELTKLDELRRALRDEALHHAAPAALRERLRAAVIDGEAAAARTRLRPQRAFIGQPGWRIAAACVLAFGAGAISLELWNGAPRAGNSQAQLARDVFASHWRALAAATPVDVVSSDRHTVKPWFAGKVAQAPLVQDFAAQGFPLVGGRIDYVGDERVPVLVYRHGQHLIDVFVLPASATPVGATSEQGYSLQATALGDQRALVVSDMDAQESQRFTGLLAQKP